MTFNAGCDDVVSADDDDIIQSVLTGYIYRRHIDGGGPVPMGVPPFPSDRDGGVDSSQPRDYPRSHRHGAGGR